MSVILSRGDNRVGGVSSDAVLRREYAKRMTAPGQAVLRRHGAGQSLTAQVQALFPKYSAAGGMWDFTDTSTLFQDSAGTTPVTASTQPVGKANDISGQANHLNQTTSAARPQFNGAGITPDGVDDFLVTAANLDLSACDKVVTAMGYTKVDTSNSGELIGLSNSPWLGGRFSARNNAGWQFDRVASGGSIGGDSGVVAAYFAANNPAGYGALIGRHSIPGDLSEVWWNGTKGVDGTGDKGTGNFGSYPLYILSRAGGSLFSNTPTRRALVLAPVVASPQVSDDDVELIRQWLMEGA